MTVTESVADQTDHLIGAIVCENVTYSYGVVTTLWRDVRKFTADAILFREIQIEKRDTVIF